MSNFIYNNQFLANFEMPQSLPFLMNMSNYIQFIGAVKPFLQSSKRIHLMVESISTNIFRHVNNYIKEKHGSKEKLFLLIIFKVFVKNKWPRRKLKFNRLLHDIRRISSFKQKKTACFYFSNLFTCLEILP